MNAIDFLRANEHKGDGAFLSEAQFLKNNWSWLKYSYAIAIKVRSSMAEQGMTQKQLAEVLHCTQQHVSVLLNGHVNMTLETIAKLEDAQGLSFIQVEDEPLFLNSPRPGEKMPNIKTSTLVDGYSPRKKKGPKKG